MKPKIFSLIIIVLSFSYAKAQVAIGKSDINGTSTLLDFANNDTVNPKGLILPAVTNAANVAAPANGTFIFDSQDNIVKVYENNAWVNLSETGLGTSENLIINNSNDVGAGVVISDNTTSPANGVLVLESSNKAIILPKIENPDQNVKSPYPGMMCYDTATKSLAVFDGTNWYYWK